MKYYLHSVEGSDDGDRKSYLHYLEVSERGFVLRQVIAFSHGEVMKYDIGSVCENCDPIFDELANLDEFEGLEISADEFCDRWIFPTDDRE